MKKKYHGIVTLATGFLAICGIAGYFGSGLWQHAAVQASRPAIPNAKGQIKVPSADQVRRMSRLYDRMAQLAHPAARVEDVPPLALFGYQAEPRVDDENPDAPSGDLAERKMRLTLTILAGLFRYCIVDGCLLAEGATTEAGGTIVKIEAHRVLVALGSERRWFYLEDDPASAAASDIDMIRAGKERS